MQSSSPVDFGVHVRMRGPQDKGGDGKCKISKGRALGVVQCAEGT